MTDKLTINDKITFIAGFLALILALSPFKESLDNILINFFGYTISLTKFILIMSSILFVSIYLYLIDSIKYSYVTLFNLKLFNWISKLGDLLYIIAILLPILTMLAWGLIIIILFILPVVKQYDFIISNLIAFITALIAYHSGDIINKKHREKDLENAFEVEEESIIKAKKAFEDRYYEYMLIELNNGLLSLLYIKLSNKINLGIRGITNKDLIDLSYKQKIIDKNQTELLHKIRLLRNESAHGLLKQPISRDLAKKLLDQSEEIIKILN